MSRSCYFDASALITIESNVQVGPGVRFITSTHRMGPPSQRAGQAQASPVLVGAGSWIGAGAIILPGVSIGRGTVIAAGAVVTRDCAADTLYGGVPARALRTLPR